MTDQTPLDVSRAAKNQALCREVNERILGLSTALAFERAHRDFICECADPACTQVVRLTVAEYEALRMHPTRFVVVPSEEHIAPELEAVVERYETYWTLQATGVAADIAEKLDPRSR